MGVNSGVDLLRGLDLFSGIGGISIALSEAVRTVVYCEQDKYAQAVLLSRMSDGTLDRAPIWDDVSTLRGEMLPTIDIIFWGFPCQDISVAGAGAGLGGKRSGLFYEIVRLTKEIQPTFVFLENVPAIRTRGLGQVVKEFTEMGYDCRWTMLSAASVGANHKRERWFLLAYAKGKRHLVGREAGDIPEKNGRQDGQVCPEFSCTSETTKNLADTNRKRLERSEHEQFGERLYKQCSNSSKEIFHGSWWESEPDVGRVVNGLPQRPHRIKCLGNSVVPLQVRTAFYKLMGLRDL